MIAAKEFPINCGTLDTPSAIVFNKGELDTTLFEIVATESYRITTPASTVQTTADDRVVSRASGLQRITDYELQIRYRIPGVTASDVVITSSDTSILRNPIDGFAEGVRPGSVTLSATDETGETATLLVSVAFDAGAVSDTFLSYAEGSLAKSASDEVDSRIAGKDASAKLIFTTQDHGTPTYVRNAGCWAADIDLTSISPWNSTGGNQRAGTLISPRHVIFCEHLDFHPSAGATIRFVAQDNTVVTRTITALATPDNYVPYYPDITIGVLDSDVPESISFAKVLPSDYADYLPSVGLFMPGMSYIPALALDQEEKALITEWIQSNTSNSFASSAEPQRLLFFESITIGDSGNPAFLIIDGELVLLNTWTFGGGGGGTSVMANLSTINSLMTTLGGGYQLTEVDLSEFPDYS